MLERCDGSLIMFVTVCHACGSMCFSDCSDSCHTVPPVASRDEGGCLLPECRGWLFCRQHPSPRCR